MKCQADRDYLVVKYERKHPRRGEIKLLACAYCDFSVWRIETPLPQRTRLLGGGLSGRSGLGRYNRMRGRIVRHLHAEHRDKLVNTTP